jgi:hypothetical protein
LWLLAPASFQYPFPAVQAIPPWYWGSNILWDLSISQTEHQLASASRCNSATYSSASLRKSVTTSIHSSLLRPSKDYIPGTAIRVFPRHHVRNEARRLTLTFSPPRP